MEKTLYPKTKRISTQSKIIITEKLDGSNIGFFKLNGELIIAQRNNVFKRSELNSSNSYKGLIGWLDKYENELDLNEGSGVFGEWIGMGKINYGEHLSNKFYIFAKANINDKLDVTNINYERSLFIYPFVNKEVPSFIGVVPVVEEIDSVSVKYLDELYNEYTKQVGRKVEGFVINNNNNITKYVRYKDGKESEHKI